MIPPLWTRQPLRAKRTGSKRFLPKNTNGNGSTPTESNYRTSQPLLARVKTCNRLVTAVMMVHWGHHRRIGGQISNECSLPRFTDPPSHHPHNFRFLILL